jgi:hypothetical protein
VVSLLVLCFGLFNLQREHRVHSHGHRVLARIQSISHGHRSGSSTTFHFNTVSGEPGQCRISGHFGEVGAPLTILYLPESPSICTTPDHHGYLRPFFFILLATVGLIGSWTLYQRARRGEQLLP